jgi:GT2 family glycosyltransferase
MNITCIIPTKASGVGIPVLLRCLKSVRHAEEMQHTIKVHVVLVSENEYVRRKLPKKYVDQYIWLSANYGFSEKNNEAIEKTISTYPSNYYLFLNDDAWLEKDFFMNAYKELKPGNIDLLGAIVYENETRIIDSYGSEYFSSGYAKNACNKSIKTTLLTAACLFVKRDFLKKMKRAYGYYYNPLLFYYMEDVEFCIRALGIHGILKKSENLIVHHIGSFTSGKKSYFPMYYTYRNIVWVILITWPLREIARKVISILVVQIWVMFYSTMLFGPKMYIKILIETLFNLKNIMRFRKNTINNYASDFVFSRIFSIYAFRTHHGLCIKI